MVIAGFKWDERVFVSVDLFDTLNKEDFIITGFANHFGLALITNEWRLDFNAEDCKNERLSFNWSNRICICDKRWYWDFETWQIDSRWNFKEFKERENENSGNDSSLLSKNWSMISILEFF